MTSPAADLTRRRRVEVLLVVLITCLALAVRLYRLPEIPIGLHGDEAANGVDVLGILRGQHSIFFERNNGREPLFIYLQALAVACFGATPFALRLTSAVLGTATVPAFYWMTKEAFRGSAIDERRLALWAALCLAISYWHVSFSRLGFRVIMLPLLLCLTFAWFWRAWRILEAGKRFPWVDLTLCGACMGMALYTYVAARFVPLLFLVTVAAALNGSRPAGWYRRIAGAVVMVGTVAVLVFAPLGVYFLSHPASFVGHSSGVSFIQEALGSHQSPVLALATNAWRTLGMFGLAGDENWRHNPALLPAFDLVLSVCLLGGVVLGVRRRRTLPFAFSLAWLVIFLLPAVFGDSAPHFLRSLGAVPAACLLIASALVAGGDWLASRMPGPQHWRNSAAALLPLPIMVASGYAGLHAYYSAFDGAQAKPDLWGAFNAQIVKIAPYVAAHDRPGDVWILPVKTVFALPDGGNYDDIVEFLTGHRPSLRVASNAEDLTTLAMGKRYGRLITWQNPTLEQGGAFAFTDPKDMFAFMLGKYGRLIDEATDAGISYRTYELPEVPDYVTANSLAPAEFSFGGKIKLTGFAYGRRSTSRNDTVAAAESHSLPSGESAWIALRWIALEPVPNTLKASLYLTDASGHRAGQVDDSLPSDRYLWSSAWQASESGESYHTLPTLPAVAPGRYYLDLVVYDPATGVQFPVTDPSGTAQGQAARLGAVEITRAEGVPQVAPATVITGGAMMPPDLALLGYDLGSRDAISGGRVALTLYWQAKAQPKANYTVRLSLEDDQGQAASQQAAGPAQGAYPTTLWQPGEIVRDWRELELPSTLPPGSYALRVSVERDGQSAGQASLGTLDIDGKTHTFVAPVLSRPDPHRFGERIGYVGADVPAGQVSPGSTFTVTLHWQALATIDR